MAAPTARAVLGEPMDLGDFYLPLRYALKLGGLGVLVALLLLAYALAWVCGIPERRRERRRGPERGADERCR